MNNSPIEDFEVARPAHGLFITGTNTEVGKTYVASQIAAALRKQGIRVGVYKPVASGCRIVDGKLTSDDAVELWTAAGKPLDLDAVCPQRFAKPIAPHLAAKAEGREADFDQMLCGLERWANFDLVIVEGAGGLMSPVADDWYSADLALECSYPVVVVAANRLGVINETLQTLITASTFRDGLDVRGVVLNGVTQGEDGGAEDESLESNWTELQSRSVPPCLCRVTHSCRNHFTSSSISYDSEVSTVDWMTLATSAKSA